MPHAVSDHEVDGAVRVPIIPARGPGGTRSPRLYETVIDGEQYVVWETQPGSLRATKARCPHRPRRPTLHLRGVLDEEKLVCTVHGNAYSARTGECVASAGADSPGCLTIFPGWRDGDHAVLRLS